MTNKKVKKSKKPKGKKIKMSQELKNNINITIHNAKSNKTPRKRGNKKSMSLGNPVQGHQQPIIYSAPPVPIIQEPDYKDLALHYLEQTKRKSPLLLTNGSPTTPTKPQVQLITKSPSKSKKQPALTTSFTPTLKSLKHKSKAGRKKKNTQIT